MCFNDWTFDSMYKVPDQYFFRIHHVRPRFKTDLESVLFYFTKKVSIIPKQKSKDFADKVEELLKKYPGNAVKTDKTIKNWRTEISALFGFIESDTKNSWAGKRAIELAEEENLINAFKKFLFFFQYPGGHIKPYEVRDQLKVGINFKPAQFILKLLYEREESTGKRQYISRVEACHCIFNDLRCTRDNEDTESTWRRILENRENGECYDSTGDIIRYAGDILDYLEYANLLVSYNGSDFYLNKHENESILKFIESKEWFDGYDQYIGHGDVDLNTLSELENDWFHYVNSDLGDTDFSTDITSLLPEQTITTIEDEISKGNIVLQGVDDLEKLTTADIGNIGEALVFAHECEKLKIAGHSDKIHLIKRIPTAFAVGYDISSLQEDGQKRKLIEVKTTISKRPMILNSFHMTSNEWRSASTYNENYFVYRLMINTENNKLYILPDPVYLYKHDLIEAVPSDGMDITYKPDTAGHYEELLTWTG